MNGIPSFFLGIRVHYYIRAGKAVNGAKIIKKLVINNGLWRINANHFFSTLGLPNNRPIIKVKHKNEDTHTFCGILRDQHILFIQEMYLTRTFFFYSISNFEKIAYLCRQNAIKRISNMPSSSTRLNIYINADMFIEVIKAEYMDGYRLLLLFNNGERKIVDLSNSLKGTVYTPLKEIDYFKRFSIKFNTVEWENGADFAPEYLYEIGTAA